MQFDQQREERIKTQRIKTKALINDFYHAWEHRSDHPGMLSFADFPEVRIKVFVDSEEEYKDIEWKIKALVDKIKKDDIKLEEFEGQSIKYRIIVEQISNIWGDETPVRYYDKFISEI